MRPHDTTFCREAFEFVEQAERLSSTQAVMDATKRVLARFGFEFFCFNTFPRSGQKFSEVILASRLPAAWIKLYVDEQFVQDDPSIRQCKTTAHPFEWKDAPYDPKREPKAAKVVQCATDFGLSNGFLVPIPGPAGCDGDVWMGGYDVKITPHTKPGLHLIGLYAFDRVRRLRAEDTICIKPQVTAREREVLTWVARGKSAWEIGEILTIAKRTVDEHVQAACRKLNAHNRTQAVAMALRERIIDI